MVSPSRFLPSCVALSAPEGLVAWPAHPSIGMTPDGHLWVTCWCCQPLDFWLMRRGFLEDGERKYCFVDNNGDTQTILFSWLFAQLFPEQP